MSKRIITLTTDFGWSGAYVGAMKGVILSINPDAVLVDISHDIPPQGIRHAATVLEQATPRFPPNSIHLAVVDPGVGTERGMIYARIGEQHYVAPDNGLLSALALQCWPSKIIAITDRSWWLPDVSATFHGRDIMAPVAAQLSLGLSPEALGALQSGLVQLAWPEVRILENCIEGEVVHVDSFGNLVTNISAEMLAGIPAASIIVHCDEHETMGLFKTYGDQPEMTFIALIGSSGHLELAIVNDNAAMMLGVREGAKVSVSWSGIS